MYRYYIYKSMFVYVFMIRYLLKIIQTCELMQMQIIVWGFIYFQDFSIFDCQKAWKTKSWSYSVAWLPLLPILWYQYVHFIDYTYVPCNTLQCQYLLTLFIGLSMVSMWSQALRLTKKSKLVLDGQRKNKGLYIFWIDFYSPTGK